jgi:two-component system chemotaxis response regulator CheB
MAGSVVRRDIVVIGASAGGVSALPQVLQPLPENLAASVFIVQHQAPSRDPQLVNILRRTSSLDVRWAEQGERFEPGCVYLAPPDVHLSFTGDHLSLTGGPRENYARPSIDRLFRSAAATHASRTIGVILTGMMEDGVAGALAIREAGGRTIVQDPLEAAFPELPSKALATFTPDFKLPLDQIPPALLELVGEEAVAAVVPRHVQLENALESKVAAPAELDELGVRTPTRCPECGGALWWIGSPNAPRWRCYLGHVATPHELLVRSNDELERALWFAVRALNDHAIALDALGASARATGAPDAGQYEDRARDTRLQAEVARKFVVELVSRPR